MALVAGGDRQRIYSAPNAEQERAAEIGRPAGLPDGSLPDQALGFRVKAYGMEDWIDIFTNRQLVTLMTFSDLVGEARGKVRADALAAGQAEGTRLEAGGTDADAYADAVAVYLTFSVSALANLSSSLTSWRVPAESPRTTFGRQAISMVWDFVESNPVQDKFAGAIERVSMAVGGLPALKGYASQADARTSVARRMLISTDPPYYDNIGYSDLSDYFYVWLRRSLGSVLPSNFATLAVPKTEELVANPYRHGGADGAREYFEAGFRQVFASARANAFDDYPIAVYYAFKQSDSSDDGDVSSGWETLLDGMVQTGWQITATWPMRTEGSGRLRAVASNALASSIILALRPRSENAPATDRPGFIAALKAELGQALDKLQAGGIAPVDLPQAAIGPGMAVFSRYSAVREFDGSQMSVRSALARINEVLDEVLTEQEGDFDPVTRFCIAWYRQNGYGEGKYGDAELLGNARGIAVATLHRDDVLHSAAGKVRLLRPTDLPEGYDVIADDHTSDWEALHHLIRVLEADGVEAAGRFLALASGRSDSTVHPDLLPELAHLLFRISEDNKWIKEAMSFNQLVTAWTDVHDASRAAAVTKPAAVQQGFDFSAVE
jgi:putative DNA methylase